MSVNVIDLILGLILIIGAINGYRKGVIMQLGGVVGVLLSVWVTFKFGDQVGKWIGVPMSDLVAYLLLFVVALTASWLVTRLLSSLIEGVGLSTLVRVSGAIVSIIFSSLILALAVGFIREINDMFDLFDKSIFSDSVLTGWVEWLSDIVFPFLRQAKDAIVAGV